jgi:hypothetical protein
MEVILIKQYLIIWKDVLEIVNFIIKKGFSTEL